VLTVVQEGSSGEEPWRRVQPSGMKMAACGVKFPKATAKITDDLGQLLAFCGFPAERWVHLRTASPVEPTFATVRRRAKVTRGPGSRAAGLAMAFKLIERPGEDTQPAAPAAA
jgi:hypothetical protein